MSIKIILSVDGTEYAGKTTFCNLLKKLYEQVGMTVEIIGQPRKDTVYGRLARQLIAEGAPDKETAEASTTDMLDTLDSISKRSANVIILDRHICSPATLQGDDGLQVVLNNKRLLRHNYGPEMYIQMCAPYDLMVERYNQRLKEEGPSWDQSRSDAMIGNREAWDDLVARIDKIHRGIIGTGICAVREIAPCSGPEQKLKALEIVRDSMSVWITRTKAVA